MNFYECLTQAFNSLKSNKMRSFLTMLGITIGVFSIVAIMAIGNAAQSFMDMQFEKLGANIIQVSLKSKTTNSREWIKTEHMDIINEAIPNLKNIHAFILQNGNVVLDTKVREATVVALVPQSKDFRSIEIMHGRFLTNFDIESRANVVIVNDTFAKKYFNRTDVVGEVIQLSDKKSSTISLNIIGVRKSEGSIFEDILGENYPTEVILPLSTAQDFYGMDSVDAIEVSVVEKDKTKEIGEKILKALDFSSKTIDNYAVTNSAEIQQSLTSVLNVVSAVLLIVAILTLVVGGIGVINILLVSVTERIREIGIRKALGAQRKDIVMQFVTESLIMTISSGLLGILLGIIVGWIISYQIHIPPIVDLSVISLSLIGTIILGLLFGVYPAKIAADLDPIQCLRYE